MPLNVKQALTAAIAIEQLIKADKDNKFVFSGATRVKLALNLRKVSPLKEEFQKQNDALVKEYGTQVLNEKGEALPDVFRVEDDSPKKAAFDKAQKDMLDVETTVSLSPVNKEDLVGKEGDPRSNQLAIDLLSFLFESGLLVE